MIPEDDDDDSSEDDAESWAPFTDFSNKPELSSEERGEKLTK
jgi:hypothetical protein